RWPRVSDGDVLLKTAVGDAALTHRKVGGGQVFLLGFCVQDTSFHAWRTNDAAARIALHELFRGCADQATVMSHITSSNPDVEASVRASDQEAFVFVISHEARDAHARVVLRDLPFTVGSIEDVATQSAFR